MIVRRGLHKKGLRFRLHSRDLPGCPDLVFPSRRVVVFIHGCFWHAHAGCRYYTTPQTDAERWREKLEGNSARDARNQAALCVAGWRVIVVWECELRDGAERRLDALAEEIKA